MQFQRLRLSGFKSFVEPTEFRIEPGLTGIVGPNGCGKSNLLEALRWVMGANSAKAMRAGGMDDVIFAGSGARPPRNHADVALTIDELYGQRSFGEEQAIDPAPLAQGRYAHFVDRAFHSDGADWGVFSLARLARTPEFRQAAA